MHFGDVANQLLDDDRLAHAGAPEHAGLATFGEGGDQVDDFDAGFEHFGFGGFARRKAGAGRWIG
jgi:hypothetical protein